MKKIGIVTQYYNSCNYGGLLQAYALEKYLLSQGFEAQQISFKFRKKSSDSLIKSLGKRVKTDGFLQTIRQLSKSIELRLHRSLCRCLEKYYHADALIRTQKKAMVNFREEIIHTDKVYDADSIYECDEFDIYICGSDQVWHGISSYKELNVGFWLRFVKDTSVKIAYAASISQAVIPEEAEPKIQEALKDFRAISVREHCDKEKLEKILHHEKKVEWVLDPTLLLNQNEWEQIAAANPYAGEKYIFAYLLGTKKQDRKCIKQFAKSQNLKIITIPYLHNIYEACDRTFGDIQASDVSPNLWISLIANAEYVFTDSFHGSVFSILFHKSFFVFKRSSDKDTASMNSRIYSLFQLFQLKDRLISNQASETDILQTPAIDYSKVDAILKLEQQKSCDFLLNAIRG